VKAIEASAGTGKTFEICQRVLVRVGDGGDLRKIVVVSFTEAAAADLRRRVRERLQTARRLLALRLEGAAWKAPDKPMAGWVESADGAALDHLDRALADFDEAPISTVHGLCSRILRTHAFEAGAPFALTVNASNEVGKHVVNDLLRRMTSELSPTWLAALAFLSLDRKALGDLAELAAETELELVPETAEACEPPDLDAWTAAVEAMQVLWEAGGEDYCVRIVATSGLRSVKGGKLKNVRAWVDKPTLVRPIHEDVIGVLEGYVAGVPEHLDLTQAIQAVVALHGTASLPLAKWANHIRWKLVRDVREALVIERRRASTRSYDDLVRSIRDAAFDPQRGPTLRARLAERFHAVLVDEAQDNNPDQWQLLQALFLDRLTVVGDPKQSIYAFRRASVHAWFKAVGEQKDTLPRNFRSDGPLVNAVNHLFKRWPHSFAGAPQDFDAVQFEHAGRRTDVAKSPLELLYIPHNSDYFWQGWPKKYTIDRLAKLAAEQIATLLDSGAKVKGRRVLPSDCAVLTRDNKQAELVRQALADRGIPANLRGKETVLSRKELVAGTAEVLAGFADPSDRDAVSRALASSLVDCTATSIHAWRQGQMWTEVVGRCRHWGEVWRRRGVMAALLGWMEDKGGLERLLRSPTGEREVTDLRHLAEVLQRVEAERRLSPDGLIAWLRRGGEGLDDDEDGLRVSTDEQAVHIATLHKAKGLEYGFVWLPFSWRSCWEKVQKYYDRDKQRWVLDVRLGIEPEDGKLDALQEDLRLLYVGLTRAEYGCTLFWLPPSGESALGYLLHRGADGTVAQMRSHARGRTRRRQTTREDLDAWASHAHIGLSQATLTADPPRTSWTRPPVTLETSDLERKARLDLRWRRGSFTTLMEDDEGWTSGDEPPPDTDRGQEIELPEALSEDGELVPLSEFPAGTQAGDFMHAVLEHHDYDRPEEMEPRVRRELLAHGFDAERWTEEVSTALNGALEVPLWPGSEVTLAGLDRSDTAREVDVSIPVCGGYSAKGGVTVAKLAKCFEQPLGAGAPPDVAERLRRLTFKKLRGFLVGQIDLLFRVDQRYFVLDWKSKRLGKRSEHYRPEAMKSAVLESGYVLQYHLYVLFLHRMLRQRLGDDYDYDQHVGGVVYAFLRGMNPSTGAERGVFRDRPPKALITSLDACFSGDP